MFSYPEFNDKDDQVIPGFFKHQSNALSFYRSQNVLCRSKFFEPAQKFNCIWCLFKNFCAGTKTNFTECKSSFCLAQNVCDWHNMHIHFWSDTKNLDWHETFLTCKRT